MRILLVGHGRMGRLVESLAGEYGCEIVGIVDPPAGTDGVDSSRWNGAEVAIDFSSPDAVLTNVEVLARRGIDIVLGTTGWDRHEAALRQAVAAAAIGIVAAPNFSTGVVLFESIVAHAAKLFAALPEVGAFVHEAHHSAKKDAPSGTALKLERAMREAGFIRPIDISSTRAGSIPGTHTIGFDAPGESITLTHAARDRSAFARGALTAAAWVRGRQGWFSMQDVLGL
jgi:4-hydroxy-tetrahydrodipicolinate reductase